MAGQRLHLPYMTSPCKKRQHRTEHAARAHLLELRAKNAVWGTGRPPGFELAVYQCPGCGYYHVGHRWVGTDSQSASGA